MSNTPTNSQEPSSSDSIPAEQTASEAQASPTPSAEASQGSNTQGTDSQGTDSQGTGPKGTGESANTGARPKIQVGRSTLGPRTSPGSGAGGGGGRGGERPRGQKPQRGPKQGRDHKGKGDEETEGKATSDSNLFQPATRSNVPVPSKRERISPDLEAELNDALGDLSLDQIVDDGAMNRATEAIEPESRRTATVVRVDKENVFFSLGGKNEGLVALIQFKDPPAVGTQLEVIVKGTNPADGLYDLVVPGASIDVSDWSDLSQGAIVEARVTGANTGGLECMVNNIRGFIPSSQVGLYRVENFAEFVNQKLLCVVVEVNPQRKNLVLSRRALLEREQEENRRKFLAELQPGQIHEGIVRSVKDFGVFVDMGGVDGLIHISQLSWDRIKHPSEVVQEGQKVRVKVEKYDEQTGKISLSYRDLLDRPWDNVNQNFPVGMTARGTVSRVANFGAFVRLAPGIEGLIHISELAHGRVRRVEDILKEGQEVEVKILSVDPEAQRISLSYKATLPPPEAKADQEEAESDGPPRPLAVTSKNRPLRGGFDRKIGGDGLGLNW